MDSNFVGFIGIAIGIFLGFIGIAFAIFFGLRGFRKGISDKLSDIENKVVAMAVTVEKAWDLLSRRLSGQADTVERNLDNLGKTKISAQPGEKETKYIIEVEKQIFQQEYLVKVYEEKGLLEIEKKIFGKALNIVVTVFSPTRMRLTLPCIDPKPCTEYMTLVLKWLDSTYFESLGGIKEFEEPILT